MNYRRGLQRFYALLTVAWIVVVFVLAVRHRPKTVAYEVLPAKYGATDPPTVIELKDLKPADVASLDDVATGGSSERLR